MATSHPNLILRHLDEPYRFFCLSAADAALLFLPFFVVGLYMDKLILGFFLSVVSFWLSRKLKRIFGKGKSTHIIYWYLPYQKAVIPNTPPSYDRMYIG